MKRFISIFLILTITSCGFKVDLESANTQYQSEFNAGSLELSTQMSFPGRNPSDLEYSWTINIVDGRNVEISNCLIQYTAGDKVINKYDSGESGCNDFSPSGTASNLLISLPTTRSLPIQAMACLKVKDKLTDEIRHSECLNKNSGFSRLLMDLSYQELLNFADTNNYSIPTESQQLLQNNLVLDLKKQNLWDKFDLLFIFASNGDRDFAKINWKNPQGTFNATERNNPTYSIDQGFSGNTTDAQINFAWTPNPNAVNYTTNQASFGFYLYSHQTGGSDIFGINNGSYLNVLRNLTPVALNGSYVASQLTIANRTMYAIDRTDSATLTTYQNGMRQAVISNPATNIPSYVRTQFFGRYGASNPSTVSLYYIGTSLGIVLQSQLNTLVTNYIDAL